MSSDVRSEEVRSGFEEVFESEEFDGGFSLNWKSSSSERGCRCLNSSRWISGRPGGSEILSVVLRWSGVGEASGIWDFVGEGVLEMLFEIG